MKTAAIAAALAGVALAVAYGLVQRRDAEAARLREREALAVVWRVEHLRDGLERARRLEQPEVLAGMAWELVRVATESIEMAPGREELWRLRGLARELLHDFTGALADYDESIRLAEAAGPHAPSPVAYFHRGFLRTRIFLRAMLVDADDPAMRDGAFEDFRRANRSMSDLPARFSTLLAMHLARLRDEDAAACGIDASDARSLLCRGVARFRLKQHALDDLAEAARAFPCCAEIRAWHARCLPPGPARAELEAALWIDRRFPEASVALGRLAGAGSEGEDLLWKAARLRPAFRLEHARVALEIGRHDRALESLADARDAASLTLRARVHAARGAPDALITDAGLAASAGPSAGDRAALREALAKAKAAAPGRASEIDALIRRLE